MAAPAIAESNNIIIVPRLEPKFRDDAALKLAAEEVAAAAAVPVPEPAGVMVLPEAVAVTPKAEVVAGVATGVDDDLPLAVLELELPDVEVLLDCGPMEKEPLVE